MVFSLRFRIHKRIIIGKTETLHSWHEAWADWLNGFLKMVLSRIDTRFSFAAHMLFLTKFQLNIRRKKFWSLATWPSPILELGAHCEFKNTETNAFLRLNWACVNLFNDPSLPPLLRDRKQYHLALPTFAHLFDLPLSPYLDLSVFDLLHGGTCLYPGPTGHFKLPPVHQQRLSVCWGL